MPSVMPKEIENNSLLYFVSERASLSTSYSDLFNKLIENIPCETRGMHQSNGLRLDKWVKILKN